MLKPTTTLTHEWIWRAIDALATSRGLTPSALARLAGLDPTTFNRSKRFTLEGRPRWPSTESIAKILEATGISLDEFTEIDTFVSAGETGAKPPLSVPLVGMVRDAAVDAWPPAGEMQGAGPKVAGVAGSGAVALEVADASLEPVYSRGHTLIVSAEEPARPGDRVIVKPCDQPAWPCLLLRANRARLEFAPFQPDRPTLSLQRASIDWMARIIWARS